MAGIKSFKKLGTESADLNKIQENVSVALEPVLACTLIDGILLKTIVLRAGVLNVVFHGLGRELIGWVLAGQGANAVVWDEQSDNPLKTRTLRLRASADVTVNLWVF